MAAHENNQEGSGEEAAKKTTTNEGKATEGKPPTEATEDAITVTAAAATSDAPPKQTTSAVAQKSSAVHKIDYQPEVVYLYQFCRSGTIPSISPFCLKVETWLRVAAVKYENVDHKMKLRSKQGKLPFVELNGAQIADSAIIIRDLGKHFDRDLDANLSREQRVIGHALESMLENHTSWVYRWWRFNNAGEFLVTSKTNVRQASKTKLPAGLVNFIVKMKLRSKRSDAIGHGIGAHTPEEIYEFGQKDLTHLNDFLGDKPYFFGDEPTTLDIVAFSHLTQFLLCHGDKFPPKIFLVEKCAQLVDHVERIKERYWPDWKEMNETLELNTHLPKPPPVAAAVEKVTTAANKGGSDDDDNDEKKDKEKGDEQQPVDDKQKQKNKKKNKKDKAKTADVVKVTDNKVEEAKQQDDENDKKETKKTE